MNKCIFIGNLTRDPEFQTTGSGVSLCRFSIAVNRTYANANGEREVDFINVVTWRGLAENCNKYLTKGSKVCIVGSLQNRSYEDKDGNKRYTTDIVAEDVEFISSRSQAGEGAPAPQPASQPKTSPRSNNGNGGFGGLTPVEDDNLPF